MDFNKVTKFYRSIEELVKRAGIKYCLLGGQAAISYRFAEFTKDYDLHIDSNHADQFLIVLHQAAEQVFGSTGQVSYRFGLGSPLDSRWGQGGWTSHFEVRSVPENPRIDLFICLPRVAPDIDPTDGNNSLHILAETKKTQRDKDWDFVKSFGVRMIEQGDTRGFLHIFDAEILIDAVNRNIEIPAQILELRPVLQLLNQDPAILDSALLFERLFWQKWDQKRIRSYIEAGREYFSKVKTVAANLVLEKLSVQHVELTNCAVNYLPESPHSETSVKSVAEQIVNELSAGFGDKLLRYLPNLEKILHQDGIYNPKVKL